MGQWWYVNWAKRPECVLSSGGTTTTGIATTTRFDHSAEKDAEIINWRRCIFVDPCSFPIWTRHDTSKSSRTRERWKLDSNWRLDDEEKTFNCGSATPCCRRLCTWRTEDCVLTIRQRFRPFHHRGPSHHSQVRDQLDLETILEKIDISCCSFFQHVDRRTTWFPHDQWERLRMVEALSPHHHVHRICQMQRISSDGGLSNVDIGHWRYGGGWNSKQAQETGKQDWAVHHWEALDGSMGWTGRAGEKQQSSHLDGLDLSNEI